MNHVHPHHHEHHEDEQAASTGAGGAFDKHAGHQAADFLGKFWIVLVLSLPILAYSEVFKIIFGTEPPAFPGADFFVLLLGSGIFFYGGSVFLAGAYRELKARLPGMMTLIALAISAAYIYSVFQVLVREPHTLFWELSTLIAIMLLGHWIEMRAVSGAKGALRELAKLLPDTAEVFRGSGTETVPLGELREGDVVLVRPGGKVPADGRILDGHSDLNESIVTGESRPVSKTAGDEVIAGARNGDGSLKVTVTKIGERTFLSGVMRLVAEAEMSKSRLQILSDRAAFYLTVVAVASGAFTFVAWFLAKAGVSFATERLVAVLVIACPHALGLAVPLVASISTTLAARSGLLVRRRMALEAARNVDVVLFDKTGTLTRGEFGVDSIVTSSHRSPEEILEFAASLEAESEHPLARAFVREAGKFQIPLLSVKNFKRVPGRGVEGEAGGKKVLVGNDELLKERGLEVPFSLQARLESLAREGKTVNHVVIDRLYAGSVALSDMIREESKEAVAFLELLGVKVAMITGDSEDVASWVARTLGIEQVFANVLPGEKAEKVRLLKRQGIRVAMVGDGVNDAPALAEADLGIAIGAGTNVAVESAGIVLVKNDPRDIPKIIRLSKLTYRKMLQNLFWATGYNVAALPLAAGVLFSKGILLTPAVAAALMSVSTVIVAVNAMFLKKEKL